MSKYDFSGYATKANLRCSDGRVIMPGAFKGQDGAKVPLVWNHRHGDIADVIGNAVLEHRADGVYAHCTFNDTQNGRLGKVLVQHGDVDSLSICANKLKQVGSQVQDGIIREVSLVIAGANPGAHIENVMVHGEEAEDEAIIYSGVGDGLLLHAEEEDSPEDQTDKGSTNDTKSEKDQKTIKDIFEEFTEDQKTAVYAIVGQAVAEATGESDEEEDDEDSTGGNKEMKQNVFDMQNDERDLDGVLMHSDGTLVTVEEVDQVFKDGKRYGSLKEACLQHGIEEVGYLLPDPKALTTQPTFIQRDQAWVGEVMNRVHKSPFSRIKSIFADITEDDARAKGYIKGKMKKEEFFSLLKRTTEPTTVYKKQKMDRDDVIDITDFDVVSWIKSEMRMMLDEELARAILIGDGRLASSDDKINESNIRPVAKDDDLFTVHVEVTVASSATEDDKAKAFIREVIKNRKQYKGSGNPTLFTTEDMLTDMLLLTDEMGRDLYSDEAALARKLRVSKIVTVPPMESARGKNGNPLVGVVLNMADYNVGADRGGAINMFDDFDIDYNQQKYLIETRASGALTLPYSAMAFELKNS